MADDTTPPATGDPAPEPPAPTPPEPTSPPDPPAPPDLGDAGRRAIAEERKARRDAEARLKELEPLAARLRQIEDGQKTEAQKLGEKLAKVTEEAASAKAEALRFRIASKHQISDEDAETFLTGKDEETLTRQAERLVALSAAGAPSPNGSRTPVENLRPGALPTPPQQTIAEQIAAAEAAKDWATARQLKTQQLMELQKTT